MGMYDSIYLQVKCPFCGQASEMECQTKELDCTLKVWHKGDNIESPGVNSLGCCSGCRSAECVAHEERMDGYKTGAGRYFELVVETPFGLITGKYRIYGFKNIIDQTADPTPSQ